MIPDLAVHHLRFTIAVTTPMLLPSQSGSSIRGALLNALRKHYCPNASLRVSESSADAGSSHRSICPVCWLIAEEDAEGERGRNIPRPYTIEPPTPIDGQITPGSEFAFGVTLIGPALDLFPYLVLAVSEMGKVGVGQSTERWRDRGRFELRAVVAANPLTGARQSLLSDRIRLRLPSIPVLAPGITAAANALSNNAREAGNTLRIHFHTPTRIVDNSHLVRSPAFGPLFQRLIERVEGLARYYGTPAEQLDAESRSALLALADSVQIVEDHSTWIEVVSGSKRIGRATPISGYTGRAVYLSHNWGPLLPWLLWGQSVHVGKNAVKGDGWFTIDGLPRSVE